MHFFQRFDRAIFLAAALVSLAVAGFAANSAAAQDNQPASPYKMVGRVTDEETGEGIAGVKVQVVVGEISDDFGRKSIFALTDEQGQYSLSLPVGHLQAWSVMCPPGYWAGGAPALETFATSPAAPVYSKNYQLRRGPVWRITVHDGDENRPLPEAVVSAYRIAADQFVSVSAETSEQGIAGLTIPDLGGEFQMGFRDAKNQTSAANPATLKIEQGFAPGRVARIEQDPENGAYVFIDDAGKQAELRGAKAALVEGQAVVAFAARKPKADELAHLTGIVVDDKDEPLAGAQIRLALGNPQGGSGMTSYRTQSDAEGRFALDAPAAQEGGPKVVATLVVNKQGRAGVDTSRYELPAPGASRDIGRVRLKKGNTIQLRVVGPSGKSLAGAWVEPSNSYAVRRQFTTTDLQGRCTVKNLPAGVQSISVVYGKLAATEKVVISDGANELVEVRLKPPQTAQAAPPATPKAIRAGEAAPEWQVAGWSDGKQRRLADYRGKVVFLDFWGVWCAPCIQAIPAMKELHARYSERDVVFLAIHTAGTQMPQVQKLLAQQQWETPSALDEGDDIISGATVKRYGVRGFPAWIVVGRDGNVAFTSHVDADDKAGMAKGMAALEAAAKAEGVPWPLDENANQEELAKIIMKLQAHIFSREIDAALAAENDE